MAEIRDTSKRSFTTVDEELKALIAEIEPVPGTYYFLKIWKHQN